jgi:DNA-binding transcriptional ArsR family regulator
MSDVYTVGDGASGIARVSGAMLAHDTRFSLRAVRYALRKLRDAGVIEPVGMRRGTFGHYRIVGGHCRQRRNHICGTNANSMHI